MSISSSRIPEERHRPATLWEVWQANASRNPHGVAITHWTATADPVRWSWNNLLARAEEYARLLAGAGIRRGDVCALMFRHNADVYPLYMALVRLGTLPTILAYPNSRLHPEKFRAGLDGIIRRAGLDWLITEVSLGPLVNTVFSPDRIVGPRIIYPFELIAQSDRCPPLAEFSGPAPDTACLLQHSSGTTGIQKGVVLSHRTVLEHVFTYGERLSITDADCVVSWLPLYHDMGLIAAFHLPLALGLPSVQLDPFEWVVAPGMLLEAIDAERGTLSWLPNFAYNLLADRVHDDDLDGVDLESLRMLINCSEQVRPESHQKFVERFARFGIEQRCLGASYAMAEATFAVTQTLPGSPARSLALSADALSQGLARKARNDERVRHCVSSGVLLDGCEIRVVDDAGIDLETGFVGELAVRSRFLFSGYLNNDEATAAVMRGGWYFTGDYGFLFDGEYYVIGRKKDLIIVAGRNIYPEDIEAEISIVEGVIPGRVIAFGIPDEVSGTEKICVVVESDIANTASEELRQRVVRAAMRIDVTVARVEVVPPRWLIKSSAGKPSRATNRDRLLARGNE